MRRTLRQLAIFAVLALIVAGCENASAGSGSSDGHRGVATAGNAGSGIAHEKAVEFAQCMRANGIDAFPDPDASGEVTIDGLANRSAVDTSSAAFRQALNACKDLEPAGFTGRKVRQ
jgi:predicted small secreted protein